MRCGVSRSAMMRAGEPMAIELAGTSTFTGVFGAISTLSPTVMPPMTHELAPI